MYVESILKILGAGLSIWESKEKTKYLDTFLKLKQEYFDEFNKDPQDHSALDLISYKLQLLGNAFASQVGIKNPPPPSK